MLCVLVQGGGFVAACALLRLVASSCLASWCAVVFSPLVITE